MKKAIALLITLLFTTVISVLFLKNLTNTNSFVNEVSKEKSLTQAVLLVKSFQNEIVGYFSKNKEIYDLFSKSELNCVDLPLKIKDISISLNICSLLEAININDNSEENNIKKVSFFEKNNMSYYSFIGFLADENYTHIKNYKELNSILDSYIKQMHIKNEKILKQSFITFDIKEEDKYLKCKLRFTKETYTYISSFIVNTKNKEVRDFEFSFK